MSIAPLKLQVSSFCRMSASAVISFMSMLIPFCCGAREYWLCFVGLIVICAILLAYVLVNRNVISYRFDIIDLSIAAYLIAGLLNMAFTAKSFPEPVWFCKWGVVIVAYLSGRIILKRQKNLLYLFLSVSGMAESLIAILQYMGLFKLSLNGYFPHSGSFQTPGALGVFIALAIICNVYLIYYFVKIKKRLITSLLGLCLVISGAGLVVSDSRTAMIMLIVATLFYFARVLEKMRLKLRYLFYLVTAVLTVFAVVVIYNKRPDSVKTRMLLWNVALTMNRENPVTGCIILGAIHLNRYNSAYNSIGSSTQNSLYNKNIHFSALTAKSAFNSDCLNIEEKISIMKARMQRFSTSEMFIDLGDLYLSVSRYSEAEESYIRAFYMVPCRIIPLYKLFLLYKGIGNEEKAVDVAKRIVELKTSVVSSITIQLKQEAAKYLLPDK